MIILGTCWSCLEVEYAASVQVAFAHRAATSTSIRTFGKPREGNGGNKSNDFGSTDSARDNSRQIVISSSPSTATTEGTSGSSVNAVDASSQKIKKDYIEPYVLDPFHLSLSHAHAQT